MLNIHTLTRGAYGTNCYIVNDSASKACCVIDPGYTPEKILDEVNALGLTVEQTASRMGRDGGAVRALQYRAVRRLGALLREDSWENIPHPR